MKVQTHIPDCEEIDDCISLSYNIEIGELHERDKHSWIEMVGYKARQDEDEEYFMKRVKSLDFEFKMNHIAQIIKIEVIGNYKTKQANILEQKNLCKFNSL